MHDYARAVYAFTESLGIKRFFVVGHSFGGRVAVVLAAEYPEKIKGIVLISSAGLKRKSIIRYIKVLCYKTCRSLCRKRILPQNVLEKFGSRDFKAISQEMKGTFLKVINEDLSPCAKRISVPALLLWGSSA